TDRGQATAPALPDPPLSAGRFLQQPSQLGEPCLDAAADLVEEPEDALVDDPVVDVVALLSAGDDARLGEQLQGPGYVCRRGINRLRKLVHRRLTAAELVEQPDAERLAERAEPTCGQLDQLLWHWVRWHSHTNDGRPERFRAHPWLPSAVGI